MTKDIDLTREELQEYFNYDPLSGELTWKKAPSRRYHAGDIAGRAKTTRPGGPRYVYVGLKDIQVTAVRIIWMLSYGEWPQANIQYRDGDSLNLRLANLKQTAHPAVRVQQGDRRVYKVSREARRAYGRKYYYGVEPEHYAEMLAEQNGVCAICAQPESATLDGVLKDMHVDHCHDTDQVRALLCGKCNGMLGLAKDSPETLRAAADYIELHAARIESLQSFDILLEEMN